MKSLNKILTEKLVARRPSRALRLSAEKLGVIQVTLRLPEDSPLFRRGGGELLELALDDAIAPALLDDGFWSKEEVGFLVEHTPQEPVVLFDIGANIGLVTRQLLHHLPNIAAAVCYEPHPVNFKLLSHNLAHLSGCCLVQAAAGATSGQLTFYEDVRNIGNYSLNPDSMLGHEHRTTTVTCVQASDQEFLGKLPASAAQLPILWKSDTQGFDEAIVSSLSDDFWNRVQAAVIEIFRINKPAFNADRMSRILELFPIRRFAGQPGQLSVADVLQYSNGTDGRFHDLLLAKR